MMTDRPLIISENNAPECELYAMECKLTVRNNGRTCEFDGFASLEVVRAMLDIMREVVVDD